MNWGYQHLPYSRQEELLWQAGCTCSAPLLGWRPDVGPRCRLCNAVANASVDELYGPSVCWQKRLI